MNKKNYLEDIKTYFIEKGVIDKDIKNILEDYSELYDEATDLGLSHEEVIKKLGNPKEIYEGIKDTLKFTNNEFNRVIGIMPFISTILFFISGFAFNGWTYAWIFYLLIPVTAIILNVRGSEKIIALSPFVAVVCFFLTGIFLNFWHPGWLIFLIVPITGIIFHVKGKEKITALSPFILAIIYILISTYVSSEFYLYGWAIFAIIPVVGILTRKLTIKDLIMIILILLATASHVFLYFEKKDLNISWLPYLVPFFMGILLGYVQIITGDNINIKDKKWLIVAILSIVTIYLIVSFLVPNVWKISWLILLLIPIIAIYDEIKFKHPVAYTPFIAVTIFMLLGTYLHIWEYAWLAFLLIPMTAVITETKQTK
ncbi:DUF1700 domain-containing protein [Acholeplasma granularum]|uniref:DUF1700 domain-containing protein n=1 Tax=Acholeplasma granularum TaxID=264635 RepID=UPI00046E9CDE|nr:DUF1700 domain-containing protein [Acholeplasma granularum]